MDQLKLNSPNEHHRTRDRNYTSHRGEVQDIFEKSSDLDKVGDVASNHSAVSLTKTDRESIQKVTNWFVKEELRWRTVASMAWVTMVLPAIVFMYTIVSHFTIWHPLQWLIDTLQSSISLRFILYTGLIQVVSVTLGLIYAASAKGMPTTHKNYLQSLLFILNPKQSTWICHFAFIGTIVAVLLLRIEGKHWFIELNSEGQSCFNERWYFLVCLGMFVGLRHGVLYFKNKKYCLAFPAVQESLIFRIKGSLASVVKETLLQTSKILQIYYPLFYIFGGRAVDVILMVFNIQENSETTSLTTIIGLLDFMLLFESVILATAIQLILNLSVALFQIFNSQAFSFPVEAVYVDEVHRSLKDAIRSSNHILKLLAALDLCRLSQQTSKRRKQVFALSRPGNKAHTWTTLCGECLRHLRQITAKVDNAMNTGKPSYNPGKDIRKSQVFMDNEGTPLSSLGSNITPKITHRLSSRGSQKTPGTNPLPTVSPLFSSGTNLTSKINGIEEMDSLDENKLKKKNSRLGNAKRLPFIEYLLKEDPDYHFHDMASNLQLSMWIIEGLAGIVASSITEDTYGVVQRDLCEVVSTYITFLEAIEQMSKTVIKSSRPFSQALASKASLTSIQHLNAIKLCTQTSLYKITTTFGAHLSFLKLTPGHRKRLQNFLNYHE